jgi:hypothetical protein
VSSSLKHFVFAVIASALVVLFAQAAEDPHIARSSPAAVRPGETVKITFSGTHLDGLTTLWTSFPATSEALKTSSAEAVFSVTVASNVPVQIGAVRLAGTNTLSNLHLVMVDDLPSRRKEEAKKQSPQSLSIGTALDGVAPEMAIDYFSFSAKKGEELSIEVLAHRLGSTLDPLIRVLDPTGKELAWSLQSAEPNGDPRIRFIAPATANYQIELRDVAYQGGKNFFYRLRFGKFPLITAPFPPMVQRGKKPHLALVGPSVAGAEPPDLGKSISDSNSGATANWLPVSAKFRHQTGSGFARLALSDLPEVVETEPNDEPARAVKISLPVGLNGRFEKPRDRDYYQFEAEKDDRLIFVGRTRSLGSSCDLSMRLVDSQGAAIGESTNTTSSEGLLLHKFSKPGIYHLIVEELTGAAGPNLVYHIEARRQRAGFALSVESDKVEKSTNGGVAINVSCARDRYDGPITLSVAGLDGCRLENALIAEKKTNTNLRIIPESRTNSALGVFRIVGEATIAEKPVTAHASTIPALRKTWPMLLYPPEQFDGLVWIGPR